LIAREYGEQLDERIDSIVEAEAGVAEGIRRLIGG
jgi:hypothetical protein